MKLREFTLTIFAFLTIILVIHFSKSDVIVIKTPLLLGIVLWAPFLVADDSATARQKMSRLLAIGSALALGVHFTWFAQRILNPQLSFSDIASTTAAAVDAALAGRNPYREAIDLAPSGSDPSMLFTGYKYLPAMLAAYLPTVGLLNARGILVTNFIADLSCAWLIFRLGRQIGGPNAGLASLFFYLALPALMRQNYNKAANDLVALAPSLLALLALPQRPALSGFWLGVSIAAKPLPGAAFLPCCLPSTPRARVLFAAGFAAGLLPIIPFAIWSPTELFDNIVRFNLVRPADRTSWLFYAPPAVGSLARIASALVFLGAAARFWRGPASRATRIAVALVVTGCVVLSGPVSHQNYLLWWLPLLCLLVGTRAAALWPARERAPAVEGRELEQHD